MKSAVWKSVVVRTITLIPLLGIFAGILHFLFDTNLPQLLYNQSIRDIYFDCLRFTAADYVYTMKPGECRLRNIEYDIVFSSDTNGFRNGIRTSNLYDVAVIGDSFAHGYGVKDEQTFPYLLESTYRYKTVNLAIGSYATMRELEALREHGKDAKYVVVQYCSNDLSENEAAIRLSKENFKSEVETQWRNLSASYREGKSMGLRKPVHDLAVMLTSHSYGSKATWRREQKERPIEKEASAFAQVVARYRALLEGKRLIVLEASMWGANSPRFVAAFGSELSRIGWLDYKLLNTADVVGYEDYFFLDDHMNTSGHRELASAVAREMAQWESADPALGDRQDGGKYHHGQKMRL